MATLRQILATTISLTIITTASTFRVSADSTVAVSPCSGNKVTGHNNSQSNNCVLLGTRTNRVLKEEEAELLVELLKPLSGCEFWIVTETNTYDPASEPMLFSQQLGKILEAAGLKRNSNQQIISARAKAQNPGLPPIISLPVYTRVNDRGIIIGYAQGDMKAKNSAETIAASLSALRIDNHTTAYSDLKIGSVVFYVGLS